LNFKTDLDPVLA